MIWKRQNHVQNIVAWSIYTLGYYRTNTYLNFEKIKYHIFCLIFLRNHILTGNQLSYHLIF